MLDKGLLSLSLVLIFSSVYDHFNGRQLAIVKMDFAINLKILLGSSYTQERNTVCMFEMDIKNPSASGHMFTK